MMIQVRLPVYRVELGWLNFWDLQHNLVVINIHRFHTLQGKLMATAGMLADNPGVDYCEELAVSTCQITMILNLAANSLRTNYFIKQLRVVLSKTALQRMSQSSYVQTCHDKVSIDIAATLSTWYWWCLSPIAIINTCTIATTCKKMLWRISIYD